MSRQNDLRRKWFGGKWIRPERRLAIYLRDGFACVWCRRGIETEGVRLSLDHLKTNRDGGGNESANLVTACTDCNSARAHRSVKAWTKITALRLMHVHDVGDHFQAILKSNARDLERYARACARRPVPLAEAKRMIAERFEKHAGVDL